MYIENCIQSTTLSIEECDDWLDYLHEFLIANRISWKTILIVSTGMFCLLSFLHQFSKRKREKRDSLKGGYDTAQQCTVEKLVKAQAQ